MFEEMNKSKSAPGAEVIERILEFSAEAQIERRQTAQGSSAFQNLTGAVVAYGRILGLLSKLPQPQEEHFSIVGRYDPIDALPAESAQGQ